MVAGLVGCLLGCSAFDGTLATYSSGRDRGKVLSALEPVEAAGLCASARGFMAEHLALTQDALCRFSAEWEVTGVLEPRAWDSDEAVRTACRQEYDRCMRTPGESCSRASCTEVPYPCDASVAELEACGSVMPGFWEDLFRRIPACDQYSVAVAAQRRAYQADLPAACANLKSKCPRFQFEDQLFLPFPGCR